jgi:hypothetical protein
MKRIYFAALLVVLGFSGCNKLKDVNLDTNPYDKDYNGPKVAMINHIEQGIIQPSDHYVKVVAFSSTVFYSYVVLYRNGLVIGTYYRKAYNTGPLYEETFEDHGLVVGQTYTYQIQLKYESGYTSLSDGCSVTIAN